MKIENQANLSKSINRLANNNNPTDMHTGWLGNGQGVVVVPNSTNGTEVYVRIMGQSGVKIAFNSIVPNANDLPVEIGYYPSNPIKLQIIRQLSYFPALNLNPVPSSNFHHQQHEYGGLDPVAISKRQYLPFRLNTYGFLVVASPDYIYTNGQWNLYYPTGATDLSGLVPTTGSRYILVSVDADGLTTDFITGTVSMSLALTDIPELPFGNAPIAAVKLYSGQTGIYEYTDILDLRGNPFLGITGSYGDMYQSVYDPSHSGSVQYADYSYNSDKLDGHYWNEITGTHALVTLDANADSLLAISGQQLGLDTKAANLIFSGPVSGAVAVPTFRSLVVADIPLISLAGMSNLADNSIIGNNTGSSATPIALTVAQTQTLLGIGSIGVLGNGASQYQVPVTGATPFTPVWSGFLLDGTTGGKTSLAVTSGKTLTLTATDNFNLTVPATGTVAMLGVANLFTAAQTITGSADAIQLKIKANATQTATLQEWQNSSGTLLSAVDGMGSFGIGVAPGSLYKLIVNETKTANTGFLDSCRFQVTVTPTGTSDAFIIAARIISLSSGTQNITGTICGLYNQAIHASSGTLAVLEGGQFIAKLNATGGNVTNAYGAEFTIQTAASSGGVITNVQNVNIKSPDINATSTTTITNLYGIYINSMSIGTSLNYALYTNVGRVHFGDRVDTTGGLHVGGASDAGNDNLLVDGTGIITGGFGCNSKTAQTAYASGGAVVPGAGAFGFDSAIHAADLATLVTNIRLALVANGIMS